MMMVVAGMCVRACVRACLCVCARARACVRACVCVCGMVVVLHFSRSERFVTSDVTNGVRHTQ